MSLLLLNRFNIQLIRGLAEVAGALVTPETATLPRAEKILIGSTLIFELPSVEEIKEIIENDAFYKNNVVCGFNSLQGYEWPH